MDAVRTAMNAPATWLLARLALAAPFALSGVLKLTDFSGAVAEVGALGLAPAPLFAAAVIVTQLVGAALLFTPLLWLGAGMLAVFTAIATLLAHAFWSATGALRIHQLMTFTEHAAIVGGFAAAAIADWRGRRP